MRQKLSRNWIVVLIAAAALFTAGCNKSQPRTDAQVASDIQAKLNADQAVNNKQIAVLAANGVITLAGSVNSEAERSAAAGDAAGVNGVRTVVNNLTVQPADATTAQNAPADVPPPSSTTQRPAPAVSVRKPSAAQKNTPQAAQNSAPMTQADAMRQANNQPVPVQSAQYAPPAPPPAPRPQPPARITIPDGAVISARMLDTLDSENANPGDTFRATLNSPIQVDGRTVVPADADLYGRVVDARSAGRFKGSGLLAIELTKVGFNGRTYTIHTDQWSKETQGRGRNTAEKVGGGAALGAIIGAIAGGGKGAGIGTAVGAGAGGVAQGASHAPQIKLGPESLLTFHLQQPVTVQPASMNERNAGRQRVE